MIRQTDRVITDKVWISCSLFYDKSFGKTKVDRLKKFFGFAEKIRLFDQKYRSLLNIPSKLEYRICKHRGNTFGQYIDTHNVVEIDYRTICNHEFLGILLAHELVHAEQYHTGKLKHKNNRWVWTEGRKKLEVEYCEAYNHTKYMQFPWEQEAYGRQQQLFEQAEKMTAV